MHKVLEGNRRASFEARADDYDERAALAESHEDKQEWLAAALLWREMALRANDEKPQSGSLWSA